MSEALLAIGDFNIIAVDWGGGSASLYSQSAANTRLVGLEVAYLINFLKVCFVFLQNQKFSMGAFNKLRDYVMQRCPYEATKSLLLQNIYRIYSRIGWVILDEFFFQIDGSAYTRDLTKE